MKSSVKTLRIGPQYFKRFSKLVIFCLLILVGVFVAVNNWSDVYLGNAPSWMVVVPVLLFFTAENAVKIWVLKSFRVKIVCYVLDTLCLITLTIFTNGELISTLYMIILSEFYISQESLVGSIVMGASSIVLFLVAFGVSSVVKSGSLSVAALITNALNDILLMALHFMIFNFAVQIFRKNRELDEAVTEQNRSNEKLREAYAQLNSSNEKLREAYSRLREVTALEERQRIAKDIHDTAGHSITTVVMQTEAAKLAIDSDPQDAKRKIAAANLQAKNALEELRESVHLLSGESEKLTLKEMLLNIVYDSTDGTGIVIRCDIADIEVCDAKRRFLCNTLKEGISNGLRHGGATAFYFELKEEDDRIEFLLSDNGKGMELSQLKEGFGLTGMHARAASLGGTVWFETEEDEGFEIHMTLPTDGTRRKQENEANE